MRKHVVTFALAIVMGTLGFALSGVAVAGNGNPPSPPGQDECQHGNSGKPCKDDPQPDKGKDCEEHGNQGGVNEDHCDAVENTTTETTETTETTTTETTETTETTNTETTETTATTEITETTNTTPETTPTETTSTQNVASETVPVESAPEETSDSTPASPPSFVGLPPTAKQAAVKSESRESAPQGGVAQATTQAQKAPETL